MPFTNGIYSLPFRIGTNTPTEPQYSGQVGADLDELASVINGQPFVNVLNYGAVGDDNTDDTAAIQAAVDAAGNNIIFFPAGGYLVSSPITCSSSVMLYGAGRDASSIFTNTDTTLVILDGKNSTVYGLSFTGSSSLSAANPTVIINPDCNNCQIENNLFEGGRYNILNYGTDNTFFNNEMRYAFGNALMKCVGGSGNFIIRNKMDQVWPAGQPSSGYVVNAWASGTPYVVGDVVTTSGWRIQCTVGGTSGSVAPTLVNYETDIVDGAGTLRWQICSPTDYYSFQMDSGASENFMSMNDHSGCFSSCIGMTDTGDDGGSGEPYLLWVTNAIMGQHVDHGVHLVNGHEFNITNSELGNGWASGGTAVVTETGWDGGIVVTGANTIGIPGNTASFGIKLYGAFSDVTISNNRFPHAVLIAVKVDDGGGAITDFSITDNNLAGGGSISIDANTDWYVITNNNTHGGGVSDGGSGTNKTVTGNI